MRDGSLVQALQAVTKKRQGSVASVARLLIWDTPYIEHSLVIEHIHVPRSEANGSYLQA